VYHPTLLILWLSEYTYLLRKKEQAKMSLSEGINYTNIIKKIPHKGKKKS